MSAILSDDDTIIDLNNNNEIQTPNSLITTSSSTSVESTLTDATSSEGPKKRKTYTIEFKAKVLQEFFSLPEKERNISQLAGKFIYIKFRKIQFFLFFWVFLNKLRVG